MQIICECLSCKTTGDPGPILSIGGQIKLSDSAAGALTLGFSERLKTKNAEYRLPKYLMRHSAINKLSSIIFQAARKAKLLGLIDTVTAAE